MKKLVVLLVLLAVSSNFIFAQTKNDSAVLSKKEQRKAQLEQQYKEIKDIIKNKSFVLETDYLRNRYTANQPVSSMINFVKVDSNTAVIQIGSHAGIGPNGVGGVTAKGKISSWKLTENNKKNSLLLRMNVMTPIGIYDVRMTVSASGNATAELTGLKRGELIFDGDIVPLDSSRVYEGISI